MSKFIKVIKFYKGYPGTNIHTTDVYLNIDNIESFEEITYKKYGTIFSYYYKEQENKSELMRIPTDTVNILFISTIGEYYFSKSFVEDFIKLQECEMVHNRFEILDL